MHTSFKYITHKTSNRKHTVAKWVLSIQKTWHGPFPVTHPRSRLTTVTDDEQFEEVIVVPGHAGSWWLTPALCRLFALPLCSLFEPVARNLSAHNGNKENDRYQLSTSSPRAGGLFHGLSRCQRSSPSAANSRKLASFSGGDCTQLSERGSLRRLEAQQKDRSFLILYLTVFPE